MIYKKVLAAVLAGMMVMSMAACGGESTSASSENTTEAKTETTTQTEESKEEETSSLSGSVSTNGSTSMEKVIGILSEEFMAKNPDVGVTYDPTGSGTGIEAASNGSADIGLSSRALKEEESSAGLNGTTVALDGIAIIVNAENPVNDLSVEQIAQLFTGAADWSAVGGEDMPIVVVGREAGSGTRGAFEEILGVEDQCAYANELDSTGAVMAKVASTPGAIGYISLDAIDDSVAVLQLDGVDATAENIKAGTYFLNRPFVMATNGEISAQSGLIQAWFEYVFSAEGQEVVANAGLITVE